MCFMQIWKLVLSDKNRRLTHYMQITSAVDVERIAVRCAYSTEHTQPQTKWKRVTKTTINKFHLIALIAQWMQLCCCLSSYARHLRWHLSMPSAWRIRTHEPLHANEIEIVFIRRHMFAKSCAHTDTLTHTSVVVEWVQTRMTCTLFRFDKCVYEFKFKHAPTSPSHPQSACHLYWAVCLWKRCSFFCWGFLSRLAWDTYTVPGGWRQRTFP